MRPSIATVVGPSWEPRLVEHARIRGLARVIGRVCDPGDLASVAGRCDAVFVGSDAPWLAETDLRGVVGRTRVIGVAGDEPGRRLLAGAGVVEVVDAVTPPAGMLSLVVVAHGEAGRLVEVTGPRGAPGRSEVALALAYGHGTGSALVEADVHAPSLGLRMGLGPFPSRAVASVRGVTLSPLPTARSGPLEPFVDRVRSLHSVTVLDAGPHSRCHLTMGVDEVVIVGEATDVGVVRLATLCDEWSGPMPLLVVNRHRPGQDLGRLRRATGLEPLAVIPLLPEPVRGAPMAGMRAALGAARGQRTAL